MEFTADWFSHNIPIWEKIILQRLPSGPRKWLELGSYEGRSAAWVLDNVIRDNADELVCVDRWYTAGTEARFDANVGSRVTKINKDCSQTLFDFIAANREFDVIYIDGDHDGRVTLENAVLAWRVLKDNGLLVFDDYHFKSLLIHAPGRIDTNRGIDAFLSTYYLNMRVLYHNWQVIIEKLPLVR